MDIRFFFLFRTTILSKKYKYFDLLMLKWLKKKKQKYGLIYVKITLVYRPIFVVFGKKYLKVTL